MIDDMPGLSRIFPGWATNDLGSEAKLKGGGYTCNSKLHRVGREG